MVFKYQRTGLNVNSLELAKFAPLTRCEIVLCRRRHLDSEIRRAYTVASGNYNLGYHLPHFNPLDHAMDP